MADRTEKKFGAPLAWSRNARRVAIWASLALVCAAALAALLMVQGIDRQIDDLTDNHATRTLAHELTHELSQAEAGQRGFLLTGNPQFLAHYEEAATAIAERLDQLLTLTSADPARNARVTDIAEDITGKLADMSRTIDLARQQRMAEAQSLVETDTGVGAMADAGRMLDDFIAAEDAKMAARNAEMDGMRLGLVGALIAALLSAAILASALLMRTQREVSALSLSHQGLVSQNEVLEAQVIARTSEIEAARAHAERERLRVEALLQDANHRIGNSLAMVSSLLALQVMRSRSSRIRDALEAARLRIHAIASAHRRLRLGDDMDTASAQDFLTAVVEDIAATQADGGRVSVTSAIEPIDVRSRDATTLGILVSELVTNALKHAFPDGRQGSIEVRLFRDETGIPVLQVRDDGVGLAESEAVSDSGLGSLIVSQLAGQFDGEPHYQCAHPGVEIRIALPGLARAPQTSLEV